MKKITLLIAFLFAFTANYGQTAIQYGFEAATGTYTELASPTVLGTATTNGAATSLDDVNYRVAFPAGFTFNFSGTNQTDLNINTNGFVGFGTVIWTNSAGYTPLSSNPGGGTTDGIIAAFGADLNAYSSATTAPGTIGWQVEGSGTDEVFVVQYKNFKPFQNSATVNRLLNFQIRLYESTHATKPNYIEFVYGNNNIGDSGVTAANVGIRNAGTGWMANVNSLTLANIPAGNTCTWLNAVTASNNSLGMYYNSTNNAITLPNGLVYTYFPQGATAPAMVKDFAATTFTSSTATISWTAPANATQYNVQYRQPNSCTWTNWTGNPVTGTTVTLTGLTPLTTYQVRVQASNGTANAAWSHTPNTAGGGNGYTANGTFTTLASCVEPTALTASAVTASSATIGWTAPVSAPASGYDIYYSTTNTAPVAATAPTLTAPAGATSLPITTLQTSTPYYVWVRSNCGGTDGSSVWAGPLVFTTLQVPAALPFTENFETASQWSIVNGTQTNKWFIGTATNNGGANSLYVSDDNGVTNAYDSDATSTVHAYRDIVMPVDAADIQISFDWKAAGEACCDYLRVWVVPVTYLPTAGTTISAAAGRIQVGGNLNVSPNFTTATYNVQASAYAGQTFRLVFEWTNDFSDGTSPAAAVDNISIQVASCSSPTAITALVVPGTVTIGWTAPSNIAPAGGYEYYYATTNTAPVAGTTASGTATAGTTSAALTTLTPDTIYYVWVRSVCGANDKSSWSGPVSFRVDCPAQAPSTVVENFSNFTGAMPNPECWREAIGILGATPTILTGTTSTWTNSTYNNITGNANGTAVHINLYGTDREWVISPAIDLGTGTIDYQLEFDASVVPFSGTSTVTAMGEKFVKVVVSTDGGATWTEANVIRTYDNTNIPAGGGISEIISLDGYTGVVKIGFYAYSTTTAQDLRFYIDNYRVREVPACSAPTALTLGTITETSVQISYTAPDVAPASGYQFYTSTANTAPTPATAPSGTVAAGVLTATVPGLQPLTTNYIWVRSNCGTGLFSEWVGPLTAITLCDAPEVLTTVPGTVCGIGTATLSATATGGTIMWYAAATGGTALGTGAQFTTPQIDETTTYYVTASNIGTATSGGGKVAPEGTSGTTAFTYGLTFDAYTNFTLNTVDVFLNSTTAGNVVMVLANSAGTVLQTTTVAVPAGNVDAPVQYSMALGWNITAGTGYRIYATSGPSMVREFAQVFPFAIGNVGALTAGYGGAASNYYYFYNWNFTATCPAPRVPVVVTVTDAPAITIAVTEAEICSGESTIISATSANAGYAYVWMPGNLTGASQTVAPATTTTYTVTATDAVSGCVTIGTVTVTVNPLPTPIVTDAEVEVCEGGTQALTATGGVVSETIFTENFNAASTAFATGSVAGTPTADLNTTYYAEGTGSVLFKTASTNADVNYSTNANIDLTGYNDAQLTFSHIVGMEGTTISYDLGYVQYSTDGGTTWTTFPTSSYAGNGTLITGQGFANTPVTGVVFSNRSYTDWNAQFTGTTSTPGTAPAAALWKTETINIPAAALNSSQFRIRFRYTTDVSANYYGWLIDNLQINASSSQVVWSPATNLYTDAAATVPYTGQVATTVYTKPMADITYTASALNTDTGCTAAPATVAVDVITTAAPVANATQVFCDAATVASLTTNGGTAVQWYADATGGTALAATTALVNNEIYYASQTLNGCESVARTPVTVTITIIEADAPDDVTACESYTLPALTSGAYYTATGGTGNMITAGTPITQTTTLYVYAEEGECSDENSFTVTIITIMADDVADVTACNEYTLPALVNGSYYTQPNGQGTMVAAGTPVTQTTVFYVFAQQGACSAETTFTITITTVAAPEGDDTQTIEVVAGQEATIADIEVTATGTVTWYATEEDAIAGVNELTDDTVVTAGATYYATQTVDGCTSTTVFEVIIEDITLGKEDFDARAFTYYPNPVSNVLTISYSSDITSVNVYNLLGQQVLTATPNTTEAKIDMTGLAEGTYMLNVSTGNGMKTIKVVKTH